MAERIFKFLLKNQVLFTFLLLITGWFIYKTRGIWAAFFLSYIIMAALLPLVRALRRKRIPRVLSVVIPFFSILTLIFLLILPLVPFFIAQFQSLFTTFPTYLNHSANVFGMNLNMLQVQGYISAEIDNIGKNAFSVTTRVFGGVFSIITVLIVSFYLLYYDDIFQNWVASFFPDKAKVRVHKTIVQVNDKLGSWLRGQIVLSLFIGIISWIAMTILGVPYALPLALIAAILEILPTIGPILAAVPAIIVGFTINPSLGLTVALVYLGIQMLENHLLVPKVMQRAVGLNPVLVILGITTGGSMMGIAGALLSIPFISFLIVLFHSLSTPEE